MVKDYGEFETQTRDQDGCKKETQHSQGCGETAPGEAGRHARENRIQGSASEIDTKEIAGKVGCEEATAQINKDSGKVETGEERWQVGRSKAGKIGEARPQAGRTKALQACCQESYG
ncbi:MAG: hypothetical protein ABI304_02530 [Rudaea sp.]